jgi:hypothetical protein
MCHKPLLWPIFWAAIFMMLGAGCANQLTPQVSYQGRLTDSGGAPLTGSYTFIFKLYDVSSGGTELYTEQDTITVQDGLFDTVVGPGSAIAGLTPEDLSQPLWLEVTVGNGTVTETLTPRQRLYGAPYAFTLMPGAVISSTMPASLYEPSGINGLVTIHNPYQGDPASDPALPALQVIGETGIELKSPTDENGTIYSDRSNSTSGFFVYSQDNTQLYIDYDDNELGVFAVIGTPGNCQIADGGDLSCTGTKSAIVDVQNESRRLYAIESPEVWFEDFGEGKLENGTAVVTIDPLFAETVNLAEYHVFVTPLGECNGLYVTNKTPTGFAVNELGDGTADIAFDYRLVAHRLNYEDKRLETDVGLLGLEERE